jgi:phage terminase small subunit
MVKLRQKQEKFVLEYFKTGNAASAAVMAGYSVKSVRSIASQLLTNINIKARLAELQEKAESVKIASVVERKQILTEILRAKLTDFMELGKDGSWVNIGPETKNSRAIKTIRSRTEYDENGDSPTIYTTVELTSPIEAIKELNKMERIYDDSTKVNVSIDQRQLNIYDLSSLSDQELDNLEQIVRKITPVSITDSSREETP